MLLRRSLAFPLLSLCTLACQAEQAEVTSLGNGPGPGGSPVQPTTSNTNPGESGPGVNPEQPIEDPGEIAGPLPTGGGPNPVESDAGQPQIETMVNENCAQTKVTATDTTVMVPADIIIGVDTSSSMEVEAAFVQEELNRFSQQIIASGVDARVILIAKPTDPPVDPEADAGGMGGIPGGGMGGMGQRETYSICIDAPLGSGNCPDDSNLPGYLHVNQYVASHDVLNQFIDTFPQWREQLRPNSLKAFLVISDDDATDLPNNSAAAFTTAVQGLDPELFARWNMNAVYSFSMCPNLAAAIGLVFKDLVAQTGGVEGDLCAQDFQPVFDKLATQIVENAGAELVCEWEIPPAVDGQAFSTELVDVNRTSASGTPSLLTRVSTSADCTAGGWYFDDNYDPTRIIACESTCAEMQDDSGGGIDVSFGCEVVAGCAASGEATLGGEGGETAEPVPAADDAGVATNVACEWALPELEGNAQQLDLDNVNVRYTTSNGFGVLMGKVGGPADCATAELGWHFDDAAEPTKIVACPETCEILTSRQITEVNALFGCETKPARPRQVL